MMPCNAGGYTRSILAGGLTHRRTRRSQTRYCGCLSGWVPQNQFVEINPGLILLIKRHRLTVEGMLYRAHFFMSVTMFTWR